MIRSTAAALAILFAAPLHGPALAVTSWQGEVIIHRAPGPCRSNPDRSLHIVPGQVFRSALKPANVDDNGPNTDISFVSRLSARSFRLIDGTLPVGNYEVRGFSPYARWIVRSGNYSHFVITPAPAPGVPRLYVQGRIYDYAGIAGCNVLFRGAFVLRPD